MAQTVKICLQSRRPRFNPWVKNIPWSRKWQPTPVCLSGESHGQRSLVVYSAWGCKELDTTEWLTLSLPQHRGSSAWWQWIHSVWRHKQCFIVLWVNILIIQALKYAHTPILDQLLLGEWGRERMAEERLSLELCLQHFISDNRKSNWNKFGKLLSCF